MPNVPLINAAEVDLAYGAAQCVVQVHKRLVDFLRVGQTLAQIDSFVAKTLSELGAKSCFKDYRQGRSPAFPSHACLSINDCVVHGTAGYYTKPLIEGDILKLDIGVWKQGWIGDAAWTYAMKSQTPIAKKLMTCGKESLRRGIEQLRPENVYLEWARAVQNYVEGECGFHLIRGLGGHGIGRKLHGPPFVSNVLPSSPTEWPDALSRCLPGTLLAVEPMIAVGTGQVKQVGKEWPVYTEDGSLSVHYEHDVLITPKGPRVLSEGLDDLPDVVG